MAPPWTLGSLAKLTAGMPPICPQAASAPLSSCAVSNCTVPGSNNASSRASGSRVILAGAACPLTAAAGRGSASVGWVRLSITVTEPSLRAENWSGGGESERHVVPAETERVVQCRHGRAAVWGEFPRLGGYVHPCLVVRVVQVDRRRGNPFAQGQDRGDRLHGAGPAEQVPRHRLGSGHDHPVCRRAERGGDGLAFHGVTGRDRKSTRLNSSHMSISYAVFCLKKKKKQK